MSTQCEQFEGNIERCTCTAEGCPRKGNCCACLQYHLANDQLPGCCFPPDAEKTYDRSIKHFVRIHSK